MCSERARSKSLVNAVTDIEIVEKRSLWGYRGDEFASFMKITATEPRAVPRVRDECALDRLFSSVLPIGPLHASLRGVKQTSEAYSTDPSRPLKATSRLFYVS